MEGQLIDTILTIADTLGTVIILILIVTWFVQGRLWPEAHVQRLCDESNSVAKEMGDQIMNGIQDAVTTGIVMAIHEMRKQNGGSPGVNELYREVLDTLKELKDAKKE